MKAIILAAGQQKIGEIPACLALVGTSSILSKQINLYKKIGIKDITIVIGNDKRCWKKKHREYVKKLGYTVIENSNNHYLGNSLSLKLALDQGIENFVIISDGDTYFDHITVSNLLNCKYDNCLLTRISSILTDAGSKIKLSGDKVIDIGKNIGNGDLPWYMYGGLIKINRKMQTTLYEKLEDPLHNDNYFTNSISEIIKDDSNILELYSQQSSNSIFSQSILKGGSYAGIKKLSLVRKETTEWTQKLKDEINWIENLPNDLRGYFPKVLNKGSTKNAVYYDMPYFAYPSLRRLIFSGNLDISTISHLLTQVTNFMFNNIYSKNIISANLKYQKNIHIRRMKNRIIETKKKSPIFGKILSCKEIIINGKKYKNLNSLINIIESNEQLINILTPSHVSMVHGDLHFDNILINNFNKKDPNYIFVDPRGLNKTYNYTYDLGKIMHSLHGMYDIIHEGLFDIEVINNIKIFSTNLYLKNYPIVDFYRKLHSNYIEYLFKSNFFEEDKFWHIRTLFSEASHFCSVMPFHLKNDKDEKLAIALYIVGVQLLNDFVAEYIDSLNDNVINNNSFIKNCNTLISNPLSIFLND